MPAALHIWTIHKITVREVETALHNLLYQRISNSGGLQLR